MKRNVLGQAVEVCFCIGECTCTLQATYMPGEVGIYRFLDDAGKYFSVKSADLRGIYIL